jgi:hypothetical protein
MTPDQLFTGIREGSRHQGGIRCLRLLQFEEPYFKGLTAEVLRLVDTEHASDVRDPSHVTHWTRPRGEVLQFSLFNMTGRFDDFSADHNLSCAGKSFGAGAEYPRLAALIQAFPHLLNFRINVIAPRASLAPHQEQVMMRCRSGSVGARVRLHLPIYTGEAAELTLDGFIFHLEAGTIHFVNHGCVHAASNKGVERRVHLVWDMLLTREAFGLLFGDAPIPIPATRIPEDEQVPPIRRSERVGAFLCLPPHILREEEERLDWCEPQ